MTVVETVAEQHECRALRALYRATGGPDWEVNTGWGTATDPCTWYGVTCNASGVASLIITENSLQGPIPASIGRLENLLVLNLRFQMLDGGIPPEIGKLSKLERLLLEGNSLDGGIPTEIGDLTNLEQLDLRLNEIGGELPSSIGNLDKLELLDLRLNNLVGSIPDSFANLDSIDRLFLSDNLLSGDITVALAGTVDTLTVLRLGDGAGGNDCFSVTSVALAAELDTLNPNWDRCDNP